MIGVQNSDSDCLYSVGAVPVPYPQYYAYQLDCIAAESGIVGGWIHGQVDLDADGRWRIGYDRVLYGEQRCDCDHESDVDTVFADHSDLRESGTVGDAGDALQNYQWDAGRLFAYLVLCAGNECDDNDQCAALLGTGGFAAIGFEGSAARALALP